MPTQSRMEFLPRNLHRISIAAAVVAIALTPASAIGGPGPGKGKQAPANESAPTVSGSATEGSSLSGETGTWSGSGVKFSFQWRRCDSAGNGCQDVAGAISSSLSLRVGDAGYRFRVAVTAWNKNGSATAVSEPSPVVAPAPQASPAPSTQPPAPTSSPTVVGTPQEGQTLSASPGVWSGTLPMTYRYQWQRCETGGAGCSSVTGATAPSFQLTANDVGAEMRVEVTVSNTSGSASAVSGSTAPVTSSLIAPPTGSGLTWAPPALSNPITVRAQDTGQACPSIVSPWQNPNQPSNCILDPSKDYILEIGHRTDAGGLVVRGGRNVVIVGGWITPKLTSTVVEGRGLTFWNPTGTVHVEGVLIDGAGDGILIYAPQATFQIQNVRISVSAPGHDFSLNHADVIQTWSGPKELRIDRMTATSDYQGFYWYRDTNVSGTVLPGRVIQKRVNVLTDPHQSGTLPTLHNVAYLNDPSIVFSCQDCWTQTGWYSTSYRRKLQDSLAGYYNATNNSYTMPSYRVVGYDGQVVTTSASNDVGRRQGDYMEWPGVANLAGVRWYWGTPAEGDFVPGGRAGRSYTSPGYGG